MSAKKWDAPVVANVNGAMVRYASEDRMLLAAGKVGGVIVASVRGRRVRYGIKPRARK